MFQRNLYLPVWETWTPQKSLTLSLSDKRFKSPQNITTNKSSRQIFKFSVDFYWKHYKIMWCSSIFQFVWSLNVFTFLFTQTKLKMAFTASCQSLKWRRQDRSKRTSTAPMWRARWYLHQTPQTHTEGTRTSSFFRSTAHFRVSKFTIFVISEPTCRFTTSWLVECVSTNQRHEHVHKWIPKPTSKKRKEGEKQTLLNFYQAQKRLNKHSTG